MISVAQDGRLVKLKETYDRLAMINFVHDNLYEIRNAMNPCPKCGYVRTGNDNAPDYECPKCGIVYEKYLASKANSSPPQTTDSTSRALQFRGSKRRALLVGFVGCLIISILTLLYHFQTSDQRTLRIRYLEYTEAMENFKYDIAYDYLGTLSKSKINRDNWLRQWEKATISSETFGRAEIDPSGIRAKVFSVIPLDNKLKRINTQTWVKSGGKWYREYIADYPQGLVASQQPPVTFRIESASRSSRPAPSEASKEVLAALKEMLDMFESADKASRIMGGDGPVVTYENYSNVVDRISNAARQYLSSPEAKAESELAAHVDEAYQSFLMAKVNWDAKKKWNELNLKLWQQNSSDRNWAAIQNDNAKHDQQMSIQIKNGLSQARKARDLAKVD